MSLHYIASRYLAGNAPTRPAGTDLGTLVQTVARDSAAIRTVRVQTVRTRSAVITVVEQGPAANMTREEFATLAEAVARIERRLSALQALSPAPRLEIAAGRWLSTSDTGALLPPSGVEAEGRRELALEQRLPLPSDLEDSMSDQVLAGLVRFMSNKQSRAASRTWRRWLRPASLVLVAALVVVLSGLLLFQPQLADQILDYLTWGNR